MVEKKNYPISVAEDIAAVLKYFYSIEYQYSDMLAMKFNDPHLIEIKDKEKLEFRFVVSTPSQHQDKKTYFKVSKRPENVTSNGESIFEVPATDVKSHFTTWLSLLKRYDSINLTKEDYYAQEEEKQFYDEFEITDEDASIKPLPVESQFKVYKLLEDLQIRLETHSESNPEVKEIINDAEILKTDIRVLPQSVVAKRVAKLKVKLKKIGMKFFLDIIDVAYKEAIKIALRGGIDGVHHFLS
jgi:L-rhamnose mutarotase